jgi:two-component system chemotaxis family response regulator WspR
MQSNLELQRLTTIDALTGLSNRRHFDEYLAAEWKRAMRTQEPLSLLMIDVDYFKDYNDSYGHLAGDMVLRGVAEAIQRSCRRQTDFAARFGGEEFVVVLPDTDRRIAETVAERLRMVVAEEPIRIAQSSVELSITISIGLVVTEDARESSASLLRRADEALYAAKGRGRNRVVGFPEQTVLKNAVA